MDQVRNFANTNRGTIVNLVYIFAALVIVYYVALFYFSKDDLDVTLLDRPIVLNSNQKPLTLYNGKDYVNRRIKSGDEYTISTWLYINSWSQTTTPLLAVYDSTPTADKEAILMVALYPSQSKMLIRAGKTVVGVPTEGASINTLMTATDSSTHSNLPTCDLVDIDMQRWIFLTISVNGRIMDVYMDGKLARSCILPDTQKVLSSESNPQYMVISPSTNADGQISGVRFSAYAVAPDQIYAQYQAGPYTYVGFLDYLKSKIGITVTYAGKN